MSAQDAENAPAPINFEATLERIETIVHELEEGRTGLAESLAQYEEGVRLLRQCYGLLEKAERRIELLVGVDASGQPLTEPFDDTAATDRPPEEPPRSRRRTARPAKTGEDAVHDRIPSRPFRRRAPRWTLAAACFRMGSGYERGRMAACPPCLCLRPHPSQNFAPQSMATCSSYAATSLAASLAETRSASTRHWLPERSFRPAVRSGLPRRSAIACWPRESGCGQRSCYGRPRLAVPTAEAALPAACAVEMVHTYSLVHDDLPAMDDDDLRRGRPTCHKVYGEANAILAGDALLTLAFRTLADVRPAAVALACVAALSEAAGAAALVGGQADDLAGAAAGGAVETLESIHRRKTGAMFVVSLALGAIVAGADATQRASLGNVRRAARSGVSNRRRSARRRRDRVERGKTNRQGFRTRKAHVSRLVGSRGKSPRAERLIDEACAALAPFGPASGRLEALARFVLERNR